MTSEVSLAIKGPRYKEPFQLTPKALDSLSSRSYWALYGAIVLLLILPLWLLQYIPLVDLPFHIAQAHILHSYDTSPFFQKTFEVVLEPTPNVGLELLMLVLTRVFDVYTAMRVCLSLTVIVFAAGSFRLLSTLRNEVRPLVALPAIFIFYNSLFMYGFVNCMMGIGLFFLTFDFWLRRRTRMNIGVWVILSLLTLTCFLCHLSSFMFLGLATLSYEAFELFYHRRRITQLVFSGFHFLPCVILLFLFLGGKGSTSGMALNTVSGKVIALFSPIISYRYAYDVVLLILLLLALFIVFWQKKTFALERRNLFILGAFILAFVACPGTMFTSRGADARFVPILYLLALASVRIEGERLTQVRVLLAVCFVLGLRVISISTSWAGFSNEMANEASLFKLIPVHSRVHPFTYMDKQDTKKENRAFRYMTSYGVIERELYDPYMLAIPGQHPVVFRREPKAVYINSTTPMDSIDFGFVANDFDFVWADNLDADDEAVFASHFSAVAHRGRVTLYKAHQ